MSDNLATLIDKVQALLGEDATVFSDALVTAALRQALNEWNLRVPRYGAESISGVNYQYRYELSEQDATAMDIIDVLKVGPSANELDISLDYDAFIQNELVYFRLRQPVTSADTLLVRYTRNHTINGLDAETVSTIPARHNQAMIDGGAFFSVFIRAVSLVEDNNMDKEVMTKYQSIAGVFGSAFAQHIARAAQRRKAAVGEPDARSWADGEKYNTWDT